MSFKVMLFWVVATTATIISTTIEASVVPLKSQGKIDPSSSLLLVNCIDGSLVAFELRSGKMLWKTETPSQESSSFSSRSSSLTTNYKDGSMLQFLIEPLGMGHLYILDATTSSQNPLSPIGLTMEQIVSESPLKLRDDSILLGQKKSTLHSIDLETGEITNFSPLDGSDGVSSSIDDYNNDNINKSNISNNVNKLTFTVNRLGISHLRHDWAIHEAPLLWNTKYSAIKFVDSVSPPSSTMAVKVTSSFNGLLAFNNHKVVLDSIGVSFTLVERDCLLNVLRVLEVPLEEEKEEKNGVSIEKVAKRTINIGLSPDGSLFALPDSSFPLDINENHTSDSDALRKGMMPSKWVAIGSHISIPPLRAPFINQIPLLSDGGNQQQQHILPFSYSSIFLTIIVASLLAFKFLLTKNTSTKEKANSKTSFSPPPGFENTTKLQSNSLFLAQQEEATKKPLSFTMSTEILGYGSHGTVVFAGSFKGRPVAIKRMLPHFFSLAEHEISLLQSLDDHPNVIRYFFTERTDEFVYIVLERCSKTLQTIIDDGEELSLEDKVRILRECTMGLEHLHHSNVVHRDIKPHNILITQKGRVLLSDFGLCKMVPHDQSSIAMSHQASSGTVGWRAPECILIEEAEKISSNVELRVKKSMDIYSLGILFYFVLSDGRHPFGDRLGREMRIVGGEEGSLVGITDPSTISLIRRMLSTSPKERPSLEEVLKSPLFWKKEKRLRFLLDVSDRFELEDQFGGPSSSTMIRSFEAKMKADASNGGSNGGWNRMIDNSLWSDINLHRKYNPSSYRDLLRAIRNKKNHFNELHPSIKELLGNDPEGIFENYFEKRFPFLFIGTYEWAQCALANESVFAQKWF